MTTIDHPSMDGLVKDEAGDWKCPKCEHYSGDNWSQCEGDCPIVGSPHHTVSDLEHSKLDVAIHKSAFT